MKAFFMYALAPSACGCFVIFFHYKRSTVVISDSAVRTVDQDELQSQLQGPEPQLQGPEPRVQAPEPGVQAKEPRL